jgi:hypothetical protein
MDCFRDECVSAFNYPLSRDKCGNKRFAMEAAHVTITKRHSGSYAEKLVAVQRSSVSKVYTVARSI